MKSTTDHYDVDTGLPLIQTLMEQHRKAWMVQKLMWQKQIPQKILLKFPMKWSLGTEGENSEESAEIYSGTRGREMREEKQDEISGRRRR